MKLILIILFSVLSLNCFSQFQIGENVGYYGAGFRDEQLYDLMYSAGSTSTRSGIDIQTYITYGISTFHNRFVYPAQTKGMKNNLFFVHVSSDIEGGATYTGRGTATTAGGKRTWLPSNLYDSALHSDGTINVTNGWAKFVYDVVSSVGTAFGSIEAFNEPDLSFTDSAYLDSTQTGTGHSWQNVEPNADQLPNMNASLADYVQLCKITYQVVKRFAPNLKVYTGGLGYPWFYQWFLREGGAQWIDGIAIHFYPYFDWTSYPNIVNRNSDWAAINSGDALHIAAFRNIETQEHATHLPMIVTETNIPGWEYHRSDTLFPYNRYFGNSRIQRNYAMKVIANSLRDSIAGIWLYQLGETADSGLNNGGTGSEIDAMGAYKKLIDSSHTASLTQQGIAIRTMNNLLHNYTPSHTPYVSPAGTRVYEYDSGTYKAYVVWAITTQDTSEVASGNIITPGNNSFVSYNYDQSSNGTVSGALALTGDPVILMPAGAPIIITPPGGTCNCMQLNAKLKQAR